ncbi:hypothetical protein [Helicobacter sp. 13S00477-4]|uniref:hypothetical protein n=1 Tax=Helicobacter sp. 13S00477-4 TaxID=1905759 RepID=UPI0015DA843F|nr:hypothetical protein [Helicobacter sp. 13S00477-4]
MCWYLVYFGRVMNVLVFGLFWKGYECVGIWFILGMGGYPSPSPHPSPLTLK